MTEPSWKTPEMNKVLEHLFNHPRTVSIQNDTCSNCGEPAVEFTDEVSRREFAISGLCQKCQDIIFAEPPEEE